MEKYLVILFIIFCSCSSNKKYVYESIIDDAECQYEMLLENTDKEGKINPRTINKAGEVDYRTYKDWTSGFFPGSLWYLYELTKNEKWKSAATRHTEMLDKVQYLTEHHDVGFMVGCSYLNGMRFAGIDYSSVIIQTAKSLSTRYRPNAGVIQSWNVNRGWQSEKGWECPVIIDNMMNLELLFEASLLSKDTIFYNIAVNHADNTMKNHFREDYSCYHVVDYDIETGEVRRKCTAQGYSDESAWSRGQAWALYGYVMCYRYTKNLKYLHQANKVYNFIFSNKNMPEDLVPYWDFDAPNIPNELRDVSSAAIIASALYELSEYTNDRNYIVKADRIMKSLESSKYRAKVGENGNFILMHSVGSIPHGFEIDVPLNYADYYFLEAMYRKSQIEKKV